LLAEGHLEREEALLAQADGFLFTDTNAITTYVFLQHCHGTAAARLARLADEAASRYDLVFVCETDIPYDATWDRSGDADRSVMQQRTLGELLRRKIPFFPLRGDLETRVRRVEKILGRYRKCENLLAQFAAGEEVP
jgi:HTH-type transcriptional regulator, transcriptional repressor of NAD biosynthesis genes